MSVDIDRIKALHEAATKGPWKVEESDDAFGTKGVGVASHYEGDVWITVVDAHRYCAAEGTHDLEMVPYDDAEANAEFIAAARTDLPACVAEIERLRDLNRRALAIISDAIMHGMPITPEVAAVRNGIVRGVESEASNGV